MQPAACMSSWRFVFNNTEGNFLSFILTWNWTCDLSVISPGPSPLVSPTFQQLWQRYDIWLKNVFICSCHWPFGNYRESVPSQRVSCWKYKWNVLPEYWEREREGDIDDMPFGLWGKASDTECDPINGLLPHIPALISERSCQRSEQFYRRPSLDYSVAVKRSSLRRLRGALDHRDSSPHSRNGAFIGNALYKHRGPWLVTG